VTGGQGEPPPAGCLLVVSAPSGAGKTSLVRALVQADPEVVVSVSHTTRPPRRGEREGVDYHFVDRATFRAMVEQERFLEHARVFDHCYGTSREWVATRLGEGTDVVLEIDWQGARQVRERLADSVGVFILPPSREALEGRLRARRQDDDAVVARRMRDAVGEMSHWHEFDFVIINDDFHQALTDLRSILHAERLRAHRQYARRRRLIDALVDADAGPSGAPRTPPP